MPHTTPHQPKDYKAIMLSSTFTDLKEHRARAIQTIEKLRYLPRVMEYSGAQAETDVIDTSLAMVRDATAYIGVISLKYGQTPVDRDRNPDQLSITELEFNEAMRLGRPIVLFIMSDEHPVKKADIEADPDRLKKLDAFRERTKRMRDGSEVNRVYEVFDSLEQFSTAAATAIGNLVRYLERSNPTDGTSADRAPPRMISNIPINIPFHLVGRENDFAAIDEALANKDGRLAIAALHGLRGVGKTTLAAAYAEHHRGDYRATWWIRAETDLTMRADIFGLGIQLGWVVASTPEGEAVLHVLERLRVEGEGLLLIYDNAVDLKHLVKFLPRRAGSHIIVTSTAPSWGGVAAPMEIEVWSRNVGADFLMARTGRAAERDAASILSEALGGLPLAHEQAATYCERTGVSFAEYTRRYANLLDNSLDASQAYHEGLTVARTFALAIDQAAELHPAARLLIAYAALLAPEPIPLFLFADGREALGEPLVSALANGGLDEAVGALRAYALVGRESIPDERDPVILTDCIRLHRLVREVAAAQISESTKAKIRIELIAAASGVYPGDVNRNTATWPRVRRIDAIAIALVDPGDSLPKGYEAHIANLIGKLASYRNRALAAYAEARKLAERSLTIRENMFGPDHAETALSLNNLGFMLESQGDLAGARPYYERALAIREKVLGPDHHHTAVSLNNLGNLLRAQGDLAGARQYQERALAICEKALGSNHPSTAVCLNNLGLLLKEQGNVAGARPYYERALAIHEKVLGSQHPDTAASLNNLGALLDSQGDLAGARSHYERALDIHEKLFGPDHPETALSLGNLGSLLKAQGEFAGARPYYERSLAIREQVLGLNHPDTATSLNNLGSLLQDQGDLAGAGPYYERALAIREKMLGPDHPDTANSLNNLAYLLHAQGNLAAAWSYYDRTLAICEKALGRHHPTTRTVARNAASLLDHLDQVGDADALRHKFGV